ncbi:TonB-dependent siderophore receptor [Acidomonas methanolica]|uniref:TonB-dependent siderophore receptor n=1 Tax=Acidomonas methanolica TaxID=437 RepID=UPI00211A26D6|nr:TonB-dependent siderophore receptor [Acidomonas methanolica]MCQ9154101.1 TonB-dependent siderophore receptor [Acidomonas methanolica]
MRAIHYQRRRGQRRRDQRRKAALCVIGLLAAGPVGVSAAGEAAETRSGEKAVHRNAERRAAQKETGRTAGRGGVPQPAAEHIRVQGHYVSTMASSATKSDTPLVDTAQSVTVITRNEMDVRGVLTLNQAVRYAAGITANLRGGGVGTRYDLFQLRGFTVPTFLDGLKLQPSPTGYATAQTDTSRLERVEILKGPASALYGQSSPGGLVALSSKLPLDKRFYGGVTATGGSFDLYRVDADAGGYATENGFVRYRIYGTVNGQHSQLSRTGSRRFSISPAVTFGGDGPTTLTLLGNYQYDPENGSYGGVPLIGSLKPAAFGYLPRNFYDGDVSFEKFNRRQGAITYLFDHRFDKDWSFTSRGRYDDIRTIYRSVYDAGYWSGPYTLPRYVWGASEHTHNLAFDSHFNGHVRTGPLSHALMFGFDYMQQNATNLEISGSAPPLDVRDPNYDQAITRYPYMRYLTQQHQIGIYAQDEVRWRNLILTGSLRNDWYRSHQAETFQGSSTKETPTQITWRASGLYHFDFGLAPYISYSTSFQPQAGLVSNDGGKSFRQADPSLGKQLEGGVKYQIPGTPILLTAAAFHIEQTNVLVASATNAYSTQSGLVHSDGFEFEAHIDAYKNLMVTAAFSTQDVHDDSTGKPLIQSGKGNASLFAFYTMPSGWMKGFGIGGGLRYAARAYGGQATYGAVNVPSYVVFDASASYDLGALDPSLKRWKLRASVRNLFDRNYIANCLSYASYNQEYCYYGAQRNAQASIGYSW